MNNPTPTTMKCEICNGLGYIQDSNFTAEDIVPNEIPCPACSWKSPTTHDIEKELGFMLRNMEQLHGVEAMERCKKIVAHAKEEALRDVLECIGEDEPIVHLTDQILLSEACARNKEKKRLRQAINTLLN